MFKMTGRLPLVVGALVLAAACGGDRSATDSALAVDSALNSDLALAGMDTAAQPQLTDVPVEPATKTPAARTPSRSTPSGSAWAFW